MIHEIDYFGFVYLWRDRKRKMSYIGSHFGPLDDGYTGSSIRLRRALAKRPNDFRRKILTYIKIADRKTLLLEEERWLQMIKPHHLQVRYYNIKRRGAGGFVTEGYTRQQREKYIQNLRNRRSKGANHYKSRACFCIDKIYDTWTDAKQTLGWDPIRRIKSRKYIDFYFIDEGQPTKEEIDTNQQKTSINRQRSIDAMRKHNIEAPNSYHQKRTLKTITTRKSEGYKWKKHGSLRIGRRVSIDGTIFNNLKQASAMLCLPTYLIRKRARSDEWPKYFFV